MKVEIRYFAAPATFEGFLESHDLRVDVFERGRARGNLARFYASIHGLEISADGFLTSTHGNGATPEEAIADLAKQLAGQKLVCHRPGREEFNAPTEWT